MRYEIRHTFNIDVDTFWNKLFFEEDYNQALFVKELRFTKFNVMLLERNADGSVRRKTDCAPNVEVPAVAKKIVGDSFSYIEDGRFDPKTRRWHVDVLPSAAADRMKTQVEIWVEPLVTQNGDKKCERIVRMDNTVKIFGIGGIIESFIEQQTRATYVKADAFTTRWIAEHNL